MACASAHYEEMEDLVASEVFVPVIKEGQLQGIDHAAHGVDNAACQEPAECSGRHVVQDLGEGKDAGPAHPDIEDGGYPFRAVDPECLDQYACNRDRPHNGKKDETGSSFEDNQTYRSIASRYEHGDHHVVDFFEDGIYFWRDVECMVSRARRI